MNMYLVGVNVDYLINISVFVVRYNLKWVFEVIGVFGFSY